MMRRVAAGFRRHLARHRGRPPGRRAGTAAALGAAALALLALGLAGGADGPTAAAPADATTSLLALGDTGEEPALVRGAHRQEEVAQLLAAEHRAAPVDALLLLGDNFYPDGLREREFKDRLRANVVRPYCLFLELTARGRGSMEAYCPVPEAERRPIRVLAVLGNHDYGERESPLLQHKRIPLYLANWSLPRSEHLVGLHELPGGVSVVLLQSQEILEGAGTRPLVEALRRAAGPWRIVAAHHPIADPGDGYDASYARAVRRAIARAGVTVHLFLAGHEHSLQVAAPEGGRAPPLVVISGGGYESKDLAAPAPDRLHGEATPGFVRVDVTSAPDGGRLRVTLVAAEEGLGAPARGRPRVRYGVAPDGAFREEPLEAAPGRATATAPAGRAR